MGGYTTLGTAWHFILPQHLHHRASINLLEFIAAIITIQLSLKHDDHTHCNQKHIFTFTDSSSAMGWMHHSTFNPVKNLQHDEVARYLPNSLLQHDATLHPEHIPGKHNVIADVLSHDFHLTNPALLHFLQTSQETTAKLPHNFHLYPLSTTSTSWIVSVLESLPQKEPTPIQPTPSTTAASFFSKDSSTSAKFKINSLTPSTREVRSLQCGRRLSLICIS